MYYKLRDQDRVSSNSAENSMVRIFIFKHKSWWVVHENNSIEFSLPFFIRNRSSKIFNKYASKIEQMLLLAQAYAFPKLPYVN